MEEVKNQLQKSQETINTSKSELLKTKINSFDKTVEKMESVAASLELGDSCVSWEGYWAGFTGRKNTDADPKKNNSNYTEAVLQGFVVNAKGDVYLLSRIMKDFQGSFSWDKIVKRGSRKTRECRPENKV